MLHPAATGVWQTVVDLLGDGTKSVATLLVGQKLVARQIITSSLVVSVIVKLHAAVLANVDCVHYTQ